jgi:hypothetical protein
MRPPRAARLVGPLGLAFAMALGPGLAAEAADDDLVLSLGGDNPGAVLTVPVLGTSVVVPGDERSATLKVRNDGDSEGVLTVDIVDVALDGAPDGFFDDFLVNGVPASALDARDTTVFRQSIGAGATASVPLSYEFPAASAEGNVPGPEPGLDFRVRLTLTGEPAGLAGTGGELPIVALAGSLIAVAVGGALVVRARRRRPLG